MCDDSLRTFGELTRYRYIHIIEIIEYEKQEFNG